MDNNFYAFLLTTLAGLSTLIGSFIIFFSKKKQDSTIIGSLGFASGVMIIVSLTDLIPNGFQLFSRTYSTIFSILLLLGMNLLIDLDNNTPIFIAINNNNIENIVL